MTKHFKQRKCESCQKSFKTHASSTKSVCDACGSFSEFKNVKWLPKNIDIDKVIPVANKLISNIDPDMVKDIEKLISGINQVESKTGDLELKSRIQKREKLQEL